ncbi:MAG: cache domain-containing protein, partial [Desulfobulbaceae bacterium]|nr:cache domain-containing protein [Desulfobulbaceae bacterium]
MTSIRNLSLATKFISLSLLISIILWGALDYFQSRQIATIFNQHLDSSLKIIAREDRAMFDDYFRSFGNSVRLLGSNQSLRDHLSSPKWDSAEKGHAPLLHQQLPQWLPSRAVLRAMPLIQYFLLIDTKGQVREIFLGHADAVPNELLEPRPIFHVLSHNQTILTKLDGKPFIVTTGAILDENELLIGYLMLTSPLDSDFIYASLKGMHRESFIALVNNYEKKVLASNRPDVIPPGINEAELTQQYHIIGKSFFDYGSSDLEAHFISLLPKTIY